MLLLKTLINELKTVASERRINQNMNELPSPHNSLSVDLCFVSSAATKPAGKVTLKILILMRLALFHVFKDVNYTAFQIKNGLFSEQFFTFSVAFLLFSFGFFFFLFLLLFIFKTTNWTFHLTAATAAEKSLANN